MPKLYKTIKVACEENKEKVAVGLLSTEVEKKRVIGCYPDSSLTDSEFVAWIELENICRFRIANLAPEDSKLVEIDLPIELGQTFYVGYACPTGVSGDKYVVIKYELI